MLCLPFEVRGLDPDRGSANNAGSVSGSVKDTAGAVLQGAQIVLQPTQTTATSNAQGDFSLQGIRPGTYTATISYVGFTSLVSTITVTGGQNTLLNATLKVASSSEEVVVNADLEGDAAAINEQKTSANILNVETDTQIQSLPNANIADAVGRLPGVTLQRNEGEGQYVQIRGTEPRLSNTTIDGVIVPGPDPAVRQVDLDTIPADLVGSVAINKTLSANQDGDAIGGSVDLRIKEATSDKPAISLEAIGGYTPIDNGRDVGLVNASAGTRFGPNSSFGKRFGIYGGYSYDANARGIDDVEPAPDLVADANGNPVVPYVTTYDELTVRQYLYDRTRYGFAGAGDYRLSDNSELYVHGLFSNFRDYGQKWEWEFKPSKTEFHTSVRRPNLQIEDLTLGGNEEFGNSYFKYQAAVAHSRFGGAAGNPGADFGNNPNGCSYDPATTKSIYRPQFDCDAPGSTATDTTQLPLEDINLTTGQATQLNLQAGGAFGQNYHLGTHASIFELGAQIRNEHKGQDAYSPTYDDTALANPGPASTPPMSEFPSNYKNPHYYGGSYYLPPVTNFDSIVSYLNANPAALPLDVPVTHDSSDAANYNLQERVTAGYAMNTLEFGGRFHLQTGLRIEATTTSNTGYEVVTNADGTYGCVGEPAPCGTIAKYGSGSYINPLPSVQLRYTIDKDSDIRAVYGRGISRPDPYQLVPYVVLTDGGATNGSSNLVQIGNPAIVAEHANDYDLLYEKYLPSVGMIEAGYFYKQITKPIYLVDNYIPASGSPYSALYAGDELQQEVNGDHAYVQGFEVAYQQHMTYLPGMLGGARIIANFAYTNSRNYNLADRTDTPPLVGQAPFSWNIGPAYANKRALVTMGISHNSANIYAYQYENGPTAGTPSFGPVNGPFGDTYFYSHTQIDAQASYYVFKGFTVLASGENMNNEVFGFFNGSPQYMTQREYYKPTYSLGIKWAAHHE
jgi:TonB-dependent receptor